MALPSLSTVISGYLDEFHHLHSSILHWYRHRDRHRRLIHVVVREGYGLILLFAWAGDPVKSPLEKLGACLVALQPLRHGFLQGAQDLKKAKLYSKIGKEVVSAVKKGGPNPVSNPALATVLEQAKELDVPKEIVERNIKKASEKGQEVYIEKFYEVYGYGGVGMVVEVLTDKVNRSVAAVREVVKDCGGKMADSGSVMFRFKRARVVNVKANDVDKDQLLAVALDAGAEDVIEPTESEDDTEDTAESLYKIVSSPENYSAILSKLHEEGITFEPDNGFELLPMNPIEVDDEAMELNKDLVSKLLELDDVDAVYTDQR